MKKHKKDEVKINYSACILLLISGVLIYFLANPNFIYSKGYSFLAWIMYFPFLLLIKKTSLKNVWLFSGIYGILSTGLYAYWLFNYDSLCLYFALIYYFIIMAILGLILKSVEKMFPKNYWFVQWLTVASFDYLRTLGFLGFNYGIAAYTQWNFTSLIQISSIIGVFGLNLIVLFPSFIIYAIISKKRDRREIDKKIIKDNKLFECKSYINFVSENQKQLDNCSLKTVCLSSIIYFFILTVVLVYGKIEINKKDDVKKIDIVAVQHNDNPNSNGLENYWESTRELISLTDEALDINPDIKFVIWPETAIVTPIVYNYEQDSQNERKKIVDYVLNFMNSSSANFVIGNNHSVVNASQKKVSNYNSALFFTSQENVVPPRPIIYSKNKLVPFSEYFPYEKQFPKLYKLLIQNGNKFKDKGNEIEIFEKQGLSFFTPICFENTFPSICREAYLKGARAFFCLSNDSWSNSEACQMQHMSMAVMRAVENKVPVVCSSVSGQTCIINENGIVEKMAMPFCKTYLVGQISVLPKDRTSTFYTKYGDFFGYGITFFWLALLLIKLFIDIINNIKNS